MKKSKITLLLTAALCTAVLVGCTKQPATKPSDEPTPGTEDTSTTESQKPDVKPAETKDFTLNIEGKEETVSMTKHEFDFTDMGGPALEMYIDDSRYATSAYEGEPNIVPADSGENPVAQMAIVFYADKTAKDLADEVKDATGREDVKLGDLSAIRLTAQSLPDADTKMTITKYYFDTEKGAVVISVSVTAEAAEGHGSRLELSAQSVIVK